MIFLNNNLPIKDIHLPDEIIWWPLAPVWWFVLLSALFLALLIYRKHHTATARHKILLNEAQHLLERISQQQDDQAVIREVSVLLRRTAMSLYGRHRVAGLSAQSWLAFLDKTGGTQAFTDGAGSALLDQPYKKHSQFEREKILGMARQWLEAQQVGGKKHV